MLALRAHTKTLNKPFSRFFSADLSKLKKQIETIKNIEGVCQSMKNIASTRISQAINVSVNNKVFSNLLEPVWVNEKANIEEKVKKVLYIPGN